MKNFFFYCLTILLLLHFHEKGDCKELKLATDIHFISKTALENRIKNFKTFFIPKSGQRFEICQETSTAAQFKKLKKLFTGMVSENDSFFNVVRIYYGLDTNSDPYTIQLIYLPDLAIHHNKDTFNFKTDPAADNPNVYLNANFTSAFKFNSERIQGLINSYKKAGYLKVNENGVAAATPRDLSFTNKDAESIVFPFQEIEDFYDMDSGDPLYIITVAKHDDDGGYNFYRHSIVFSNQSADALTNKAVSADLGALCPPRCKDVTVSVVLKKDILGILRAIVVLNPSMFDKDELAIIRWVLGILGAGILGVSVIALYYRSKWRKLKLTGSKKTG